MPTKKATIKGKASETEIIEEEAPEEIKQEESLPRKKPEKIPQKKPIVPENLSPIKDLTPEFVSQWVFANGFTSHSRNTGFGIVRSVNQRGLERRSQRGKTGDNGSNTNAPDEANSHKEANVTQEFDAETTVDGTTYTPRQLQQTTNPSSQTSTQHPRTGARLFLLRDYSHHLAVEKDTLNVTLTSRTFRKVRPLTKFEIGAMLQHEEAEFVKDLYLRKHKHRASDSEELWITMSAHPLVRWALDFDEREIVHLFEAAFEGERVPVERQLVSDYRKLQEGTPPRESSKRNTRVKRAETAGQKPSSATTWRQSLSSHSQRTSTNYTAEKKAVYYLKQAPRESSHAFIQRIIENERTRRLNVLSNAKPNITQLRDPKLFERRVAAQLPLQKVHDNETLSDFRALSKRLNNTFQITDVGDKQAVRQSTQNIKLMRLEERPPVGKLDWDKTCCLKRSQPGSFVKSRSGGGPKTEFDGESLSSVNQFLSSMDDLFAGSGL